MKKKIILLLEFTLLIFSCGNKINADSNKKENNTVEAAKIENSKTVDRKENEKMEVIMKVDGKQYNIVLNNSNAAKDFYNLLPLTMKLSDYGGAEKISDLKNKFNLDTSDSPSAYKGKPGDITLYAPWGNLALFYNNGPHAPRLVKLGEIKEGGKWMAKYKNDFEVRFEKK